MPVDWGQFLMAVATVVLTVVAVLTSEIGWCTAAIVAAILTHSSNVVR